jgi:predicted DNA-binding transcriptional regulator
MLSFMSTPQELLQKLGLSEKEIAVYLTILQEKSISPAEVAKRTDINRSTVYAVAKELERKGLVREDLAGTSQLLALPPERLLNLVEQEQEALNRRKHLTELAMNALEPLVQDTSFAVPRISFIDETHFERTLYDESEKWSESMKQYDGTWYGFQDESFSEHYITWIDWYWKQPFAKDIVLKTVTNDAGFEKTLAKRKSYPNRKIKLLRQAVPFTASMCVVGDYILTFSTKARPHYFFEIYDRLLAENLREIFKRQYETA